MTTVVHATDNEDNLQVRQQLLKRFARRLSSASLEGNAYFQGQRQQDGDATSESIRRLQGPLSSLNLTAPTRKCGEIIARLTVADIQEVGNAFVNTLLFPSNSTSGDSALLQFLTSSLNYSIQVQKICTSCEEISTLYDGEAFLTDTSSYGYASYCGDGRYGYNVTNSGLLLLPIDPTTGNVFAKTLRSAIFRHSTTPGSQSVASSLFPSNITAAFEGNSTQQLLALVSFFELIPALFGTSSGAVSVLPDDIGYGESYDYPKSYLVYSMYQQASVPLWLAARRMLLSTTSPDDQCTVLDNVVSVSGYSEGGYSTFSTCLALNQLTVGQSKVRVLRCQCGGTPFDLDYVISYTIEQLQNNSANEYAPSFPVFFGDSYSSTNPDLANSDKGQDALKQTYKQIAPAWLDSPTIQELIALSNATGPLNILTTSVVDLYLGNDTNSTPTRSCSGPGLKRNGTNFLCQAIIDNILVKPLLAADFPTVICHAKDDTLVPFANIPNFSSNPNVQFYQPLVPQLTPIGDHAGGSVYCTLGTIIAFSMPSNDSDTLQMMSNLTNTSICMMSANNASTSPNGSIGINASTATSSAGWTKSIPILSAFSTVVVSVLQACL